jgi:hypothetical protein
MNVSAKWLVVDENGVVHQPAVRECMGNYGCAHLSPAHPTERLAVLAWAVDREVDAVEIIAPFQRSIRDQCVKAVDNLWERMRLMGEAEGGNGTGGEVTIVVDGDGGTDTETWTPDQCDDALDGIRLAIGAIETMGEESGDE